MNATDSQMWAMAGSKPGTYLRELVDEDFYHHMTAADHKKVPVWRRVGYVLAWQVMRHQLYAQCVEKTGFVESGASVNPDKGFTPDRPAEELAEEAKSLQKARLQQAVNEGTLTLEEGNRQLSVSQEQIEEVFAPEVEKRVNAQHSWDAVLTPQRRNMILWGGVVAVVLIWLLAGVAGLVLPGVFGSLIHSQPVLYTGLGIGCAMFYYVLADNVLRNSQRTRLFDVMFRRSVDDVGEMRNTAGTWPVKAWLLVTGILAFNVNIFVAIGTAVVLASPMLLRKVRARVFDSLDNPAEPLGSVAGDPVAGFEQPYGVPVSESLKSTLPQITRTGFRLKPGGVDPTVRTLMGLTKTDYDYKPDADLWRVGVLGLDVWSEVTRSAEVFGAGRFGSWSCNTVGRCMELMNGSADGVSALSVDVGIKGLVPAFIAADVAMYWDLLGHRQDLMLLLFQSLCPQPGECAGTVVQLHLMPYLYELASYCR